MTSKSWNQCSGLGSHPVLTLPGEVEGPTWQVKELGLRLQARRRVIRTITYQVGPSTCLVPRFSSRMTCHGTWIGKPHPVAASYPGERGGFGMLAVMLNVIQCVVALLAVLQGPAQNPPGGPPGAQGNQQGQRQGRATPPPADGAAGAPMIEVATAVT